jgi:hypothetical protein
LFLTLYMGWEVEAEHGELAGMVRDFEFDHIISLVNLPKEPERT